MEGGGHRRPGQRRAPSTLPLGAAHLEVDSAVISARLESAGREPNGMGYGCPAQGS
jgi:hypothetical protein